MRNIVTHACIRLAYFLKIFEAYDLLNCLRNGAVHLFVCSSVCPLKRCRRGEVAVDSAA